MEGGEEGGGRGRSGRGAWRLADLLREVRCDGSRSKLQLIEDERNGLLIAQMQFLLVQCHIEKPKHSRPNHQRKWKEAAGSCGGVATKSWQFPIARDTFSTGGNGPSGGTTVRRRDLMLPSKRRQSENCQTQRSSRRFFLFL